MIAKVQSIQISTIKMQINSHTRLDLCFIFVKHALLWLWEFKLASKAYSNTMYTNDNRRI